MIPKCIYHLKMHLGSLSRNTKITSQSKQLKSKRRRGQRKWKSNISITYLEELHSPEQTGSLTGSPLWDHSAVWTTHNQSVCLPNDWVFFFLSMKTTLAKMLFRHPSPMVTQCWRRKERLCVCWSVHERLSDFYRIKKEWMPFCHVSPLT